MTPKDVEILRFKIDNEGLEYVVFDYPDLLVAVGLGYLCELAAEAIVTLLEAIDAL